VIYCARHTSVRELRTKERGMFVGFTIEDMLLVSRDRYKMKLIAGSNGWSNSINWVLMLEDTEIIRNFAGKELAVTTGLGFPTVEKQLALVEKLVECHASGLVINTGGYIMDVDKALVDYCDENDFPLLTVPWEIFMVDMIKDLSIQLFMQGTADEQITKALQNAIERPEEPEWYRKDLLPHFDVDGDFQVVLLTTEGLDEMDTVERRKLSYRLQIHLKNITHNGSFFYYDSNFVLVLNDVTKEETDEIVRGVISRTKKRMPGIPIYVGIGSMVKDISKLAVTYKRAIYAVRRAVGTKSSVVAFDEMGLYRLLYSVPDAELLSQMSNEQLAPLIAYDEKHNANYVETLGLYLESGGSIQAVAEAMFTHRNTVIYRVSNIKKLLGSELDTEEERMKYKIAYYIRNM